jgi:hypothetical protein
VESAAANAQRLWVFENGLATYQLPAVGVDQVGVLLLAQARDKLILLANQRWQIDRLGSRVDALEGLVARVPEQLARP